MKANKEVKGKRSSTERIWGKKIYSHGYVGVPVLLIKCQRRLGINTTQMNIIITLLQYWFDPENKPFPSKRQIASQIGLKEKTIQKNIRELENVGYIQRIPRRSSDGDWTSNQYDLGGLIEKVGSFEPEFSQAREGRKEENKKLQTPFGLRGRKRTPAAAKA